MNILIVARGYPTGKYPLNGIFEFDQAKALANQGHKVVYAAIDLRSIRRWRRWGFESFVSDNVQVCIANVPVGAVPRQLLRVIGKRVLFKIYHRIEKQFGKPDIIHAHFLENGLIAAILCKQKGLPLIITEHSSAWNSGSLSQNDIKQAKKAYAVADKLICVGNALNKRIEENTAIISEVIPNIVNMPYVDKGNIQPRNGTFRFLSAGNLIDRKGFDILLKAFAIVQREHMGIELVIMGDGPKRADLEKQAEELCISDRVSFYGAYVRMQFAEMLAQADAFVLATRHETFGVVYAEAMACGVPVIATSCGGPEDFVTDEVGILIPTDDVNALVNAMKKIISQRDIYADDRIFEYANEHFSAEYIAKRLTRVYEEVLKNKK